MIYAVSCLLKSLFVLAALDCYLTGGLQIGLAALFSYLLIDFVKDYTIDKEKIVGVRLLGLIIEITIIILAIITNSYFLYPISMANLYITWRLFISDRKTKEVDK